MLSISFFVIGFIVVLILILAFILGVPAFITMFNRKRMQYDIYNHFIEYFKRLEPNSDPEDFITKYNEGGFDYKISYGNTVYLIKMVLNPYNNEILINGPTRWQIKSSPNDESIKMIEDIEEPMLAKFTSNKQVIKKLFIIYPSCRLLMMAINECEYEFIYPTTDVHGANVITFNDFKYILETKISKD